MNHFRPITILLSIITFLIGSFFLYLANSQLITLSIALVITFILTSIAENVRKLSFKGWHPGYPIAYLTSIFFCTSSLWVIITIIKRNIILLVDASSRYQEKLNTLLDKISSFGGDLIPDLKTPFANLDLINLFSNLFSTLTSVAGNTGMILIYLIFLLIEYHLFDKKLQALFPDQTQGNRWKTIINTTTKQIQSYLLIKSIISLVTSICCYLLLSAVGVDFPDFWALMIFILNFIPTIGSLISTIFPSLLTLLQFETLTPFLIVTSSLITIQFIIGNILEPKIMGKKFNLSGLVILLSLVFWGSLWGIMGMILTVPLMVILHITLSNFPSTRPIAIILSSDGQLSEPLSK